MHPLHVLGGIIAAIGLTLFWLDQRKGSVGPDESHLEVGKVVNLSGPASLVLVLAGIGMFVFPYTSFYQPDDPNPPVATTTQPVNTTLLNPDTTLLALVPLAPENATTGFDEECAEEALFWEQPEIENVTGWWLSFESHDLETEEVWSTFELDLGVDETTFGNVTAICEVDFVEPDVALMWWVWVYAYNDTGFSEPLFVEYADL